jgi:hypothetical protein
VQERVGEFRSLESEEEFRSLESEEEFRSLGMQWAAPSDTEVIANWLHRGFPSVSRLERLPRAQVRCLLK